MRICTYNVYGLNGYPQEESQPLLGRPGTAGHTDHYVKVFNELSCDILALQEGVAVQAMQGIARQLGMHLATLPSPLNWPGHVLTRYPVVESRVFSHMVPGEETPPFSRTAGAALVQVGDTAVWVVDVHLHPGDVALRQVEGDILWKTLGVLMAVTDNVVVLGDFNSEVDEKVHQQLKEIGFCNVMETVGGGVQATMDTVGIKPHYIDHIYLSPRLKPYLKGAAVIRDEGFRHDGPQAGGVWVHSDHLPVVAELDLGEKAQKQFI
jgi:endonuclease/exonuclease/phosphatase family metal-dependent hydrolase